MLSMIVATDLDGAIGNKGDLLYHIPEDLKRFKELTTGHTIVMGRKTFESLPNQKPLPNRLNIVITRYPSIFMAEHKDEDIYSLSLDGLKSLIESCPNEEIFVIGGAEIYTQLMPYVDKIYLTKIYDNEKEADTFIDISFYKFKMVYKSKLKYNWDNEDGIPYQFIDYIRK
nr:MAG TPA: Dihydrofolate reductase [Caudoviricetes sp.]